MDNYSGDIILIARLAEFIPLYSPTWNEGEVITLNEITQAVQNSQLEEYEPYGNAQDTSFFIERKSKDWHIGRIIYFINHPDEICDIEIDNICNGGYICAIPVIVDGNHRFLAARWLHSQGKLDRVHCWYGGRTDLLDYLTGASDILPIE